MLGHSIVLCSYPGQEIVPVTQPGEDDDDQLVPGRYYIFRLTPAQFALVQEALHAFQENRTFDLTEIEDLKHREIVRQALAMRRVALNDLVSIMDKVVLEGYEVSTRHNNHIEGRRSSETNE